MELKEGMYVRYIPTLGIYTQKISKITKVKNCLLDMAYYLDNSEEPVFSSHFDDIVGVSENIIDLIEVGDYVNGERVQFITNKKQLLSDGGYNILEKYNTISSIVTKEQYENNCYKVDDK